VCGCGLSHKISEIKKGVLTLQHAFEVRCLQVGTPLSGFEAPSPPLDLVTSTPLSGFVTSEAMNVPAVKNRQLLHKK
jgi:hypothetical protein